MNSDLSMLALLSQDGELKNASLTYQALPKFMVPRQRGLTRTAAVGESILYRPRRLLGGGAAGRKFVAMAAIKGQGLK
jgi:hypothetical protein